MSSDYRLISNDKKLTLSHHTAISELENMTIFTLFQLISVGILSVEDLNLKEKHY